MKRIKILLLLVGLSISSFGFGADHNLEAPEIPFPGDAPVQAQQAQIQTHPIIVAAFSDDIAGVEAQLQAGVSVNFRGASENKTVFQVATTFGNTDIMSLLADEGADVNAGGNERQRTALADEALIGNLATVAFLLDEIGVDVNSTNSQRDTTALFWAVLGGNLDIITALIATGADVQATDAEGHTVLEYAANNPETLEHLQAVIAMNEGESAAG